MKRSALAGVAAVFLLARGTGEAQVVCPRWPELGVDPVNGNFSPTTWVDGSLTWINNPVGAQLLGVWANTDFDMWFVGESNFTSLLAVHFDGFSLQTFRLPGTGWLSGVWGSASNDVWAVGSSGLIEHWDGAQWSIVPSGTTENLYSVRGTASDDVWAAGNTVMLHWDGASWTPSPGFVPDTDFDSSTGLAAISRSDALVATLHGCQRWDGNSWNATGCGVQGGREIFATSSDNVWVVGYRVSFFGDHTAYRAHWDGSSWSTTVMPDRDWGSIGGTGPNDIWIDGNLHYDGGTWTETLCATWPFYQMSVSDNGAFMGANNVGIQYFSGNDGWPFLGRTYVGWIGLGGRNPTDLWAVGSAGTVIRYDGSRWSGRDYELSPDFEGFSSAFGSSSSDIWGLGFRGPRHFDGSSWTLVNGPYFLTGFAGAPNDAIAVEYDDFRPWHWDGTSWRQITLPIFGSDRIGNFGGTGPDDVWAVGGNASGQGVIYHWGGNSWQRVYATNGRQGAYAAATAIDDAWFVMGTNDTATVVHFDGSNFTEVGYFGMRPFGIAATGPNNAWLQLSGDGGLSVQLAHYDGTGWNVEPNHGFFQNIWGVRGGATFFITHAGRIYQAQ